MFDRSVRGEALDCGEYVGANTFRPPPCRFAAVGAVDELILMPDDEFAVAIFVAGDGVVSRSS